MGELFDAILEDANSQTRGNKIDDRLREHLGPAGWKDLEKALRDLSIKATSIQRVLKVKGFKCSYSAITRLRREMLEA